MRYILVALLVASCASEEYAPLDSGDGGEVSGGGGTQGAGGRGTGGAHGLGGEQGSGGSGAGGLAAEPLYAPQTMAGSFTQLCGQPTACSQVVRRWDVWNNTYWPAGQGAPCGICGVGSVTNPPVGYPIGWRFTYPKEGWPSASGCVDADLQVLCVASCSECTP